MRLPLPDQDGRLAILKVHARRVALAKGQEGDGNGGPDGRQGGVVDLAQAAALTSGLSGAELANVVSAEMFVCL